MNNQMSNSHPVSTSNNWKPYEASNPGWKPGDSSSGGGWKPLVTGNEEHMNSGKSILQDQNVLSLEPSVAESVEITGTIYIIHT